MPENAVVTIKLSVANTNVVLNELTEAMNAAEKAAKSMTGLAAREARQRSLELARIIKTIEGE